MEERKGTCTLEGGDGLDGEHPSAHGGQLPAHGCGGGGRQPGLGHRQDVLFEISHILHSQYMQMKRTQECGDNMHLNCGTSQNVCRVKRKLF